MTVQIQMYWLAWKMKEKITKEIGYSNQDSNLILRTDKHQSIVEPIFGELKVDEDIIFSEEYSSSDESDESQSRRNKNSKPKYIPKLHGYKKVHVPGNRNCLFSSLDMIVFNGYFDSYAQRQLITYHINNIYKKVYIDHIEGDFNKIVEKLGRIEWNSRIIRILKYDWCLNWALMWCQKFLNKAITNSIFNWEENKCSLPLTITNFHFYYNIKFKHSTTRMTPREVLFNYKNKWMIEKVIINTEKSKKILIKKLIMM